MKKRILLSIILALVMLLNLSGVALAWDNEDPVVAENENFWVASGYVTEHSWFPAETHFGGDGYNVYLDTGSELGKYEKVSVWGDRWVIYKDGIYYFATEAGGWNNPTPPPPPRPDGPSYPSWWQGTQVFTIWCGGVYQYQWTDGKKGTTLPEIDLTGTSYYNGQSYKVLIHITKGTVVTGEPTLRVLITPNGVALSSLSGPPPTFSIPIVVSYEETNN